MLDIVVILFLVMFIGVGNLALEVNECKAINQRVYLKKIEINRN